MADNPSESNLTCSEDSTLDESIWHTTSFKIVQKKRVYFWCGFGGLLSCLPTELT